MASLGTWWSGNGLEGVERGDRRGLGLKTGRWLLVGVGERVCCLRGLETVDILNGWDGMLHEWVGLVTENLDYHGV